MANPNSAKRAAADKAFRADQADAAKMAADEKANGPRVGTADKPINEGAPQAGPVPGSNERAKWEDELSGGLAKASVAMDKNTTARLVVWRDIGAMLNKFENRFLKYELSAKGKWVVVKDKDGRPAKDNNAYSAALLPLLETQGYITKDGGLLGNKNTRSACKAVALNWEEIEKIPAVLKHGHPVHAMTAFSAFNKACADARKAWSGSEEFDIDTFAAEYEPEAKTSSGGGTAPHSVDTMKAKIRTWLKGAAPLGLEHYKATNANDWKAWALMLADEVSKLRSTVAEHERTIEEGKFNAAAPAAAAKPSKARKPRKTESGDEVSEAEEALNAEREANTVDGDFTPVAPLALPAPAEAGDGEEAI